MFVSNTSTLVLLAKVGCLEYFIGISPIIEIPVQVRTEAMFDKDSYYARLIQKLIKDNKIKVLRVEEAKITEIMSHFRLDKGEAAAYILFDNKKHKAILTDDGELIKLCKLENVPFMCAMAIVIRLYEKKLFSKQGAFAKLEELHNIGRYSEKLYEHFKAEVK